MDPGLGFRCVFLLGVVPFAVILALKRNQVSSSPGRLPSRGPHPYGFSVWMAGGGIKGRVTHGTTDELGFHAVENRHYVTDLHATIMQLVGLDARRLEVPGRRRLEIDYGNPIREIIA